MLFHFCKRRLAFPSTYHATQTHTNTHSRAPFVSFLGFLRSSISTQQRHLGRRWRCLLSLIQFSFNLRFLWILNFLFFFSCSLQSSARSVPFSLLPFFCPLEGKDPSRLDLLQTGDTNMNKRKTDEDATQGRREGEEEERKKERKRDLGGEGSATASATLRTVHCWGKTTTGSESPQGAKC